MNPSTSAVAAFLISMPLAACTDRPAAKSLDDVSAQLTQQFVSQHEAGTAVTPRQLKSVHVKSFSFPAGNPHPYLGISVRWEDAVTYTSIPMVQLGDGLFGVTYQDGPTKEALSAIIRFR
jgi:hypothetical protein